MNSKIYYGQIWLVNLDPVVGREQARIRPCLVVSNDTFNNGPADLVTILPITSTYRQLSWFVEINLNVKSYIITNQPRTISKKRLIKLLSCDIDYTVIAQIKYRLKILFDL